MLNYSRKIGKTIDELVEGQSISLTETIEDSQLLLYLGLTNDANPLFIQHDYGKETEYEQPIVPTIMLMGIISSTISKHLPGPGSNIVNFSFNLVQPVYHYETLTFHFEVIKIDKMKDVVTISIKAHNYEDDRVLDSVVMVHPPKLIKTTQIEEEVTINNE
ncbi:enoyl-CoA hydratase [Vagococcus penaei]|uniref:Enoyl-CoA hydratase n=1 Tax=Vagococcus penaei TaxID=633807 RepID=A0A1Q2D3F6_9ENTE|nr:MaoC/PaaZ C-terminal domain-containing protein [Vagococcus penaei]AQP52904.1 enoyl-CoA hydratase [Vagococcus penaei]RSU01393.1 enoyl-CoA hydratase [Vagococcus penaei]